MTINRNAPAFGHKDLTLIATPTEGTNARKPFTFTSAESLKIDPGPKASALKGLTIGPVAVVSVASEPTGEFKLTVANESAAFLKHLGHTAVRFTIDAVYTRRGVPTRKYQCLGCVLDGGMGIDSSADTPPSDSPKFKMSDVLIDGVSVYPPNGQ